MVLLLPLSLAGFWWKRVRPWVVFCIISWLIWYWVSLPQLWYALPVLAVTVVVIAAVLARAARWLRLLVVTAVALFTMLTFIDRSHFVVFLLPDYDSHAVQEVLEDTALIEYLNGSLITIRPDYVLTALGFGGPLPTHVSQGYRHLFVESANFDVIDITTYTFEGQQLRQLLQANHITHVLYDRGADDYWRNYYCPYDNRGLCFTTRTRENFEALQPYLEPVYSANDWTIYEIK